MFVSVCVCVLGVPFVGVDALALFFDPCLMRCFDFFLVFGCVPPPPLSFVGVVPATQNVNVNADRGGRRARESHGGAREGYGGEQALLGCRHDSRRLVALALVLVLVMVMTIYV